MKRSRGRGRNKPHNMANRTLESNGPDVKIRGTAQHIYEKYLQLARDANSTGDRVAAENYLQHAEHYFRMIVATQGQQPQFGQGGGHYQGNGQMNGRHPNGSGEQPQVPGFQGLPGSAFPGEETENSEDGDDDSDDVRT
jgi:hypothetical protein